MRNSSDIVNVNSEQFSSEDVVQASFEEPTGTPDSDFTHQPFSELASQNSGLSNGFAETGHGIAVTVVDSANAEIQNQADLASSQNEQEQKQNTTTIDENAPYTTDEPIFTEDSPTLNRSEDVPSETQESEKLDVPKENLTEEIPSFSEWTQKQLEEAEKKREEVNSSAHSPNWNGKNSSVLKVRSKNYASPDCGAKIVAANPEAVSPSAVLSPSRDEYNLNTCSSRIWFIVELCEAIQAKKIDLANFELFSSTPKDFSVYVSDRFPSRDWSNVGQFTAKDERDLQSFELNPHLFGKYIKVELHSHYGSEHFCPVSLFRVYGTSEFEVLEKEGAVHEDDDDDDLDFESGKGGGVPKNLFTSATDAVISIVKKAAEVLGNNKGNVTNETASSDNNNVVVEYTPLISTCTTPGYLVVCKECSDLLFGKVFGLLSCESVAIGELTQHGGMIHNILYGAGLCLDFGLDFNGSLVSTDVSKASYVRAIFPDHYLAALCNIVGIMENKLGLNVSNTTSKEPIAEFNSTDEEIVTEKTVEIESTETGKIVSTINDAVISNISNGGEIKPTKTLDPEEALIEVTHHLEANTSLPEYHNETKDEVLQDIGSGENLIEDESGENLELENFSDSATPSPPQVKESVFLRLSNRIKSLERNVSLSSQYLEELSRRYKKQVEEMQRFLEKTLATLNDEIKKKDESNKRLENKLQQLSEAVEALIADKEGSFSFVHIIVFFVIFMIGFLSFCRRGEHSKHSHSDEISIEMQRRKSIDVINHNTPAKKQRRPSEEALKISGTYEHLLVDDIELRRKIKDRKRKKKRLQRSNSITTLNEESVVHHKKSTSSESAIISCIRQDCSDWPTITTIGIEEIPLVLEECDNSPLQDMPLPQPLQDPDVISTNGDLQKYRKISTPEYLKTAVEIRKSRRFSPNGSKQEHRKSASMDETKRQKSPAPSDASLSISYDEPKITPPKKEKRGTLKKIFKKVF